jgi:hypothetical protein
MVECEAQHLVFMGRSGATSPLAAEHIRQLVAHGVQVMVMKGDA